MEDPYQYPVFFDCPGLDVDRRRKIESYFHVRRKSGGGDCGSVTNVNDKVHSIAFKEREAQQRVLQTRDHVLEFADGPLVLTVRGSPGPHSSSPIATSTEGQSVIANQLLTSSQVQNQKSIPASAPPPSGESYELQPDTYLLRYLEECPKAGRELEKELASVACSAQLYPEEGRVLVRNLAQPGAADEGRNWKAEVDKLFDGYMCHYEVDPHKVRALLQSCSSHQTTDEVKVYSDFGMAVVVGKCSQVKARLMDVADSSIKPRRSRLSGKQTRICRLGEGKLRILWEEIEHSLGRNVPGVKFTQGDAGQVVLEGSVEDILKAGDWISDKEKLVLDRTVPNISLHLLAFLRKAYGGPRVLGDFLGVGDKVEIELRDTELRFFSLSADKLDDAEKALQGEFKEAKINIPMFSAVPSELREKLKSKAGEMNQGQCRAQVLCGSDSTVCLLGHTKDVEELSETVIQFILDQASIEGNVILPFPELVQLLPGLLQLHKFDYSGVTLHPLTSSSRPMVVLEGQSSKVTEVRNRLGPFLDSLVQGKVTIDLPGAVRYFESSSGRESILSIAHSQKCLIQLQGQPHAAGQNLASGAKLSNGGTTVASYSLCDGLQVLVCQGDITKQDADALVNAANEDLDHGGGVAAALSKAGGPEVQRESKALRKTRKIPTGDVVVTTGGNLKCKRLLHAVGPVAGQVGGRERFLLEKTVHAALNLAEIMEFKSIAMPCISSGLFGVPVSLCSEAIVTAVKEFGSQGGRSLNRIILIDNRAEVVRAMQEACDRILQGISTRNSTLSGITTGHTTSDLDFQMGAAAQDTVRDATAGAPGDYVHVEVVQGTIETQQVDGLVCPMAGHDPLSTQIGKVLDNVVGRQLTAKFHQDANGATLPGDVVLVEGLPALQSKAVIYLNLFPWDNKPHGTAVQVLRQCIRKMLASCRIRGFRSVAIPVLGTGAVLRFPHSMASKVLMEEICAFEKNQTTSSPFLIRIVVHPRDKESSKAFQSAQKTLHLRSFTNDANPDQASFYRPVSVTDDEVTAMLGGVKLQMVRGDIVNEKTDVIVNTTDFSNNQTAVSKAILTAGGPTVQAELTQAGVPKDHMCSTGSGLLGCREIIHAAFNCDPQLFQKNCRKILKQCESKGYRSVAFPAINTGAAGMDPIKACKAMLDGMALAIQNLTPSHLSLIRIVILQAHVFQAFRPELENRFGQIAPCRPSLIEKAKQKLKKWQEKYSRTSASQGKTFLSSKPNPAVMSVICCGPDIIKTVKRDLEGILQKQLEEREVKVHDFSTLDNMELEAVLSNVRVFGISLEHRRHQNSASVNGNRAGSPAKAEARRRTGSEEEAYVLRGLKEDVLSVTELVNRAVQESLLEDVRDKEEAMMALTVQWSIQDVDEVWKELSLHDNYVLEEAYLNNLVFVDVKAPDKKMVKVNLRAQEATNSQTGIKYRIKRIQPGTDINFPPQWESMQGEVFKKVELHPNSKEYQAVAQGFHKTANYNIQKIERVQNYYLWQAYNVCRQRILDKNGPAELGEMSLYHGTSAKSCDCIEKDRFDRNFAGTHGAFFGNGVYFAVDAQYSASKFSPADASGLRRLYVARVVTGRYTVGKPGMKAVPPRGTDHTDCFDSLVDNQQPPSMYVIFHDDQAYPEYLITFN
ncbi:protein mono-ADP-ribosyltransferase PARP14-like [Toxotes jaculatrix]|uniref:protein mono-ADP-ribosyltransferase PARP14-like n=1 Tax=Toxotes jaculatrix TaxID=941984 RepID=UPI001B3A8113|nr:protein mono-ADP-ribosyltransferase PARP14-like [Toxotes jaculatrix]